MNMDDEKVIARDRMRFIRNSRSAVLCYFGILFDVFYFVNLYQSDVGTYYYNYNIGLSVIYNLLFLLIVFLCSEGVKNYVTSYSYALIVAGVMQFVRITQIPMKAHNAMAMVNGAETKVMGDGQFMWQCIFLVVSGVLLLASALINIKKSTELNAHLKELEAKKA